MLKIERKKKKFKKLDTLHLSDAKISKRKELISNEWLHGQPDQEEEDEEGKE